MTELDIAKLMVSTVLLTLLGWIIVWASVFVYWATMPPLTWGDAAPAPAPAPPIEHDHDRFGGLPLH